MELTINERFKEKINTMDKVDRAVCHNYFTKDEAIESVLNVIRSKGLLERSGFGNPNGKVVFVVDFDKTNEPCINLIKKYYEVNNLDIYSSYLTQFSKTQRASLNFGILKKELEIIQPARVIFITDVNIPDIDGSVKMSRTDLETMLGYGKIKNSNVNNDNTNNILAIKEYFHKVMEFAILGTPINNSKAS